jgi:DNA-directed RNA polymerase subunit F
MKKMLSCFVVVLFAAIANGQPPAGDAKPGDWYGEKITADGAENIADVAAKLEKTKSVDGKIRAKIIEVCPKKGCWLKLQVNDSTTAMVKMKDYAFFLPVSAKGKTVVLDGEVKMKTTSVAELKHYAEDAKKSKEEIASITKPEKEIRVTAKGIVVVE